MITSIGILFFTAATIYFIWKGYFFSILKHVLLFPVWHFWKITFFEMPRIGLAMVRAKFEPAPGKEVELIIFGSLIGATVLGWLGLLLGAENGAIFVVGGPAFWLLAEWYLYGRHGDDPIKHVRGAFFSSADELAAEFNEGKSIQLKIGGIPLPRSVETKHFLVTGTTGAGKSHTINGLLDPMRSRGDKAFIVDSGAEAFARWYKDGDVILNPFDARSVSWSPLAEMTGPWDAGRIAAALIEEGTGNDKEWNSYARQIFESALVAVFNRGGTNQDLIDLAALSPDSELKEHVQGKPVAALFVKDSAKMLANARAIVGVKLTPLQWLDPAAGADGFSIRKWVRDESNRGWIWSQYKDEFFQQIKPLLSCWAGLLSESVLSLDANEERRIWLIVDELGALPQIGGLESALARGRKFGLSVVAGLQSVAQARQKYGRDGAQSLLACFGSWVILRAGDAETAEEMSKHLGKTQVIRQETSVSESNDGPRTTTANRYADEQLVMPAEILKFQNLEGVMSLADGIPAAWVQIDPVIRQPVVKSWEPRDFSKAQPLPVQAETVAEAGPGAVPSVLSEF